MKFKSIISKLISLIALGQLIGLAVIISVSLYSSNKASEEVGSRTTSLLQDNARHRLQDAASAASYELVADLERAVQQVQTYASTLSSIHSEFEQTSFSSQVARTQVTNSTRAALLSNPDALGVYATFLPNAFDEKDANYIDNTEQGSNETGRLAPYWAREASGEVGLESIDEADINDDSIGDNGVSSNAWYNCAINKGSLCVIEPYYDTIGETLVLMSTASVPILAKDGKVLGSAGVDIALSQLTSVAQMANNKLYQGLGRIRLVSSSGIIVADSEGENAHSADDWWQSFNGKPEASIVLDPNQETIRVTVPVAINRGSANWMTVIELSTHSVLGDVEQLTQTLNAQATSTLWMQIGAGFLVSLLTLLIAWMIARNIVEEVAVVDTTLREVAAGGGDLTVRLPIVSDDEVGRLAEACNDVLSSLQNLMKDVASGIEQVSTSAERSAQLALNTSNGVSQQQQDIEQLSLQVSGITEGLEDSSRIAENTANAAQTASQTSQEGRQLVSKTGETITDVSQDLVEVSASVQGLSDENARISSVLEMINGIAEQTNLLALNAAIEAARAGEQGRGFAVVADEVRNLAQRTRSSTQEITEIISSVQTHTQEVVATMETSRGRSAELVEHASTASDSLEGVSDTVGNINQMNRDLAKTMEQQSAVAREIFERIAELQNVAKSLESDAHESADTGEALQSAASQLATLIHTFKV
jgi:methyl-accepting chemotaxis protein